MFSVAPQVSITETRERKCLLATDLQLTFRTTAVLNENASATPDKSLLLKTLAIARTAAAHSHPTPPPNVKPVT